MGKTKYLSAFEQGMHSATIWPISTARSIIHPSLLNIGKIK
jgi:hypothetical protein